MELEPAIGRVSYRYQPASAAAVQAAYPTYPSFVLFEAGKDKGIKRHILDKKVFKCQ